MAYIRSYAVRKSRTWSELEMSSLLAQEWNSTSTNQLMTIDRSHNNSVSDYHRNLFMFYKYLDVSIGSRTILGAAFRPELGLVSRDSPYLIARDEVNASVTAIDFSDLPTSNLYQINWKLCQDQTLRFEILKRFILEYPRYVGTTNART